MLSVDQGALVPVEYQLRGRVGVVTLPEAGGSPVRRLVDAWLRLQGDDRVEVAILRLAGGDREVDEPDGARGVSLGLPSALPSALHVKPSIALVEGECRGDRLELALACDLRLAITSARLGPVLGDGPPSPEGLQRLERVVGLGRAMDLALTGRSVTAREALEMGLVTEVAEDGRGLEAAMVLATRLAAVPPASLRSARRALLGDAGPAVERAWERGGRRPPHSEPLTGREVSISVVREDHRPWTAGPDPPTAGPTEEEPVHPLANEVRSEPEVHARRDDDLVLPPAGRGTALLVLPDRLVSTSGTAGAARRLAQSGHVVLVPALIMEGEVGGGRDPWDVVTPEEAERRVGEAVETLLASEAVSGDEVGLVGMGSGGGAAMFLATLGLPVRACVSFGGVLPWGAVAPDYRAASAAFLGHHAERDEGAPPRVASRLEVRMRGMGLDATFHAYRGVGPGFWDPDVSEDPAMTRLAWERTRLFLSRVL